MQSQSSNWKLTTCLGNQYLISCFSRIWTLSFRWLAVPYSSQTYFMQKSKKSKIKIIKFSLPQISITSHHHHHQRVSTAWIPLTSSSSIPIDHCSWQVLLTVTSVCTELMNVSFCWSATTGKFMYKILEENLWVHPYFTNSAQHVFFIFLGWFVRWKISGRTTAVL